MCCICSEFAGSLNRMSCNVSSDALKSARKNRKYFLITCSRETPFVFHYGGGGGLHPSKPTPTLRKTLSSDPDVCMLSMHATLRSLSAHFLPDHIFQSHTNVPFPHTIEFVFQVFSVSPHAFAANACCRSQPGHAETSSCPAEKKAPTETLRSEPSPARESEQNRK